MSGRMRRGLVADERGFSLPELLIAIALLGMMMAAVFGILDVSQKSYTRSSSMEEIQTGVRGVMDRLASELRLMGSKVVAAENTTISNTTATAANWNLTSTTAVIAFQDMTSSRIRFRGDVDGNSLSSNTDVTASAAVASGATTVTVTSGSGFATNRRLYIADGMMREVRPITGVSGNTLTVSPSFANAYAAGALVRSIEDVMWEYCSASKDLRRLSPSGSNTTLCGTAPTDTETLLTDVEAMTFTYYDYAGAAITVGTTSAALSLREIEVSITVSGTGGNRRGMKFRVLPRSLQLI